MIKNTTLNVMKNEIRSPANQNSFTFWQRVGKLSSLISREHLNIVFMSSRLNMPTLLQGNFYMQ